MLLRLSCCFSWLLASGFSGAWASWTEYVLHLRLYVLLITDSLQLRSISPPLLHPEAFSWESLSMQTAGGTWEFSFPCGSALSLWLTCKCESPDVLILNRKFPLASTFLKWLVQLRLYLKLHPNVHSLFLSCPVSPTFLTVSIGSNSLINHFTCKCHARVCLSSSSLTQLVLIKAWSIGWEPSFLIFFSAFLWPCHVVCGILFPNEGSDLCSLLWTSES